MIIPEIILLSTFKSALQVIRDDFNTNVGNETKTILYKLLQGNSIQRYDLFTQAKKVIITTDDDPRHFDINLFFNAKRAAIPTGHITLPSENQKDNAIAISEGFPDPMYDDSQNAVTRTFNRRFNAKYNIIFTSDNTNEVVLLYHLFRCILIALTEHLSLAGLEGMKWSGSDISINTDIVPVNVHARALGLDFSYDVVAIDLFAKDTTIFDILSIDGTPQVIT